VRYAHPDNKLSGPPELHRRTECDGYQLRAASGVELTQENEKAVT
jgi:hypothetical protein